MHTVELLNRTLEVAESMGYGIRFEYLGGTTGGACEIAGRAWLFVDLALNPLEQLEQVNRALQQDPRIHTTEIPQPVLSSLGLRRAA